ncbi:MAG: WD40/YVTN/BNR-like repeat-containing protein, partial [Anaerolineales bacterium]
MSRITLCTMRSAGVALLLLTSLVPVLAQEPSFTENFDDPALPGWEHSPGVSVEDGALRVEPGNFAFHGGEWGDLALSMRVRRLAEGALVVSYRASEAGTYHVLLGADLLALQREAGGVVVELAAAALPPEIGGDRGGVGEWLPLGVSATGAEHTVTVNGEPVLTVSDPDPLPPGGIGFEALEAVGEFDDLELISSSAAPLEPESEPPVETQAPVGGQPSSGLPAFQSTPWVYTGGPSGGLGYDIRMDPRNPDVMYVTDAWAGAFKSTDGGATWAPINNGITARVGPSNDGFPVFSLTIDPNNPDTLWAGTQFGGGVFRSDDAGANWRSMSNGILERALTIRGFSVQPGNSDVVYLAGEISSWEWNNEVPLPGLGLDMTKGAIYKTLDGGRNWARIWYGDNLARYVWIHPSDHNLLFASTGIFDREAANSNPDTGDPGGVGILRSRDGGATWETLGVQNGIDADELYFGSLYMHPQNPDILLGAAGNDPYTRHLGREIGAIYRTQDGGESWERVLSLPNASAVEICERDPNVVYAASMSLFYRSDDGGQTWQQPSAYRSDNEDSAVQQTGEGLWGPPGVVAGFPIDMQCDPRDAQRIFVNAYGGGNFLSTDGGATWADSSQGYTGALMRQVVVARDNPALVYATARSGVFRSADGGGTWIGLSRGPARAMEAYGLAVNPRDSQHAIAVIGDAGSAPKITTDGGQTWQEADVSQWAAPGPGDLALQIAFSPTDAQRVLALPGDYDCWARGECEPGRGLVLSSDGGETWLQSGLAAGMALDLAFSPDGGAYLAVYPGDLYRSADGGQNWALVAQNLAAGVELAGRDPDMPGAALTALAVDAQKPERLYAGFFRGAIMLSQDGGATWQASSSGM